MKQHLEVRCWRCDTVGAATCLHTNRSLDGNKKLGILTFRVPKGWMISSKGRHWCGKCAKGKQLVQVIDGPNDPLTNPIAHPNCERSIDEKIREIVGGKRRA